MRGVETRPLIHRLPGREGAKVNRTMQCPHCRFDSNVPRAFWGRPVICPNCSGQFMVPADTFDPYYTWLGIPPAHQPPNLYRLLGLQLFEPNFDVIENAADRQMLHVRS